MRNIYVFMVLVLFTVLVNGQSLTYRTEPINGVNTFDAQSEKMATTPILGSPDKVAFAYVTWDADHIYVGLSGESQAGSITDNNRVFHIYIDTDPQADPTQGTGRIIGEVGRFTATLPFSANFGYSFVTATNKLYRKVPVGIGWVGSEDNSTANNKNYDGQFWEIAIKRENIGSPSRINLVVYVEEAWETGFICAGLPSGLFTPTNQGGGITFNNTYLHYSLDDYVKTNVANHLNNFGWNVGLKAVSGTSENNTAKVGMYDNATNGYDVGIDIPKPPTPPSDYIEVYFPHLDWSQNLGNQYIRDYKELVDLSATTSIWDFTVNSDIVGNITLSASDFGNVPSNYAITLKDLTTGTETNLRAGNYQYSNTPVEASRGFQLIIGVTLSDPTLQLSTTSINFGVVKTDDDSTVTVTLTNTGDKALWLQNLALTGDFFSINGDTTTILAKNASTTRNLKFAPRAAGSFTGKLIISSNDPTGPDTVTLAGTGQSLSPNIVVRVDTLNFGSSIIGTPVIQSFYVGNSGDTTLTVSNVVATGSAFTYAGSTAFSVAVNDSSQLTVTFTPASTGVATGTLTITSNDPDQQNVVVQLKGTGSNQDVSNTFAAGWNLMSIPVNPVSNLASDILGDDIASYFLYKYSGGAYSNSTTIDPGKGYWLGIEQAETVDVTGTPILTDRTDSLAASWNLIASPFTGGSSKANLRIGFGQSFYTVEEAVANNFVQRSIYKYTNATKSYDTVATLSPWNGHWFFTLQPGVTVKYLFAVAADNLTPKETPQYEATPSNWFVNILSEMNGIKDNFLTFGTNQDATDGFDNRFDNVKPPISPASNAIEAYFFQSDWLSLASKYASNIKAPLQNNVNKTWSFKVYAKSAGTYKLSWNDIIAQIPQEIRDNYNFILRGPGITGGINMLTQTAYEFSASAGATYSFVINSSPVGIDDEVMNLDFKLGQNYPNPFNPSTTISFSIKEAGQVTLKVYDILGNEVSTLVNEVKQPGRYDVRFEAANLPSGTYFYKLVQGKNSEIKKLMLLK